MLVTNQRAASDCYIKSGQQAQEIAQRSSRSMDGMSHRWSVPANMDRCAFDSLAALYRFAEYSAKAFTVLLR